MTTEIKIRFDGETPGLGEGRLSLGAFLPALTELLTALRRIGSNIVVQATDSTERGARGGRLAKDAEVLDLEIQSISHNCLSIDMVSTARPRAGQNAMLFDELPERAGRELMESIDAESNGKPRNKVVRKYLRKLPPGIKSQRYSLHVDGREVVAFDVGQTKATDEDAVLPGLREFVATPVGVVFAEGRQKIQLRHVDGSHQWYSATQEQVDLVLANREAITRVLVVYSGTAKGRILRLAVGDAPFQPASTEVSNRRLHQDWADVMRRLA